jgi:uncharacterized protein (DUF1015 family)
MRLDVSPVSCCVLAILLLPAQFDHVQTISEELERMPPKSTFFYPKLLSGLVFNPLSLCVSGK